MSNASSDCLLSTGGLIALSAVLLVIAACSREPEAHERNSDPVQQKNGPGESSLIDQAQVVEENKSVSSTPRELILGDQIKAELGPGEAHTYSIEVATHHFFYVVVDQQGVDIKATLFDPGERQLIQVDRPIDDSGPEPLIAVAEMAGSYTVQVLAASGNRPIGRYEIWIEDLRLASASDRSKAAAMSVFSQAKAHYSERSYRRAAEGFEEARAAWMRVGDRSWQAESLLRLGQAKAKLKEWEAAALHHQQAAELFRQIGDARWQAIALQNLGVCFYRLADLDRASSSFEAALPLRVAAKDRRGEAATLQALAQVYQVRDKKQQALDTYSRALELFERPGPRALVHHNLGVLYLSLGRKERARNALQEAERAWAEAEDRRFEPTTINQLGELYRQSGELDLALDYYRKALDLRQKLKDRAGEVTSLANIGLVYQARGDADQAQAFFLQALTVSSELRQPRIKGRVLFNLGELFLERDRVKEALESFENSLELFRSADAPTGEAKALVGLARTEHRQGDLSAALKKSKAALNIFESIRPRTVSLESRASFFATVQDHFDFHISLLMKLHRQDSTAGYDAQALMAGERARARSLLDLLVESGAKIRSQADPELLQRERDLQQQLNDSERKRYGLQRDSRLQKTNLEKLGKDIDRALQQLEEVRGRIRAQHSRYAALTQLLSLAELQSQILDDETLLLEYRLGTASSFLWVLSSHSLDSYELPRRDEIESVALKAYALLLKSHRREHQAATRNILCKLGRMLLPPEDLLLAGKRLLIVADGALQFIPFAALARPDGQENPCGSLPPLVVGHEIIHLSSASALAILRRQLKGRPPAARSVAVMADPVFSIDDPRLLTALGSPPGPSSPALGPEIALDRAQSADTDLPSFKRLRFSGQEARAILALSTEGEYLRALDFDASKDSVLRGALADYNIVHFATHGILNNKYPELSGIVLSLFDRNGRARDGFLRAHEIYNLELSADLVVLSACGTALGKVVRGEGLLSLTRGFMYAGAARVMVSLWNVNDQSTAELMTRFYQGTFERSLPPATSLREAQISMLANDRNAAPYYWAGFVIQGEWR